MLGRHVAGAILGAPVELSFSPPFFSSVQAQKSEGKDIFLSPAVLLLPLTRPYSFLE